MPLSSKPLKKLFWSRNCMIYLRICKFKSHIVKVTPPQQRLTYRLESRNYAKSINAGNLPKCLEQFQSDMTQAFRIK